MLAAMFVSRDSGLAGAMMLALVYEAAIRITACPRLVATVLLLVAAGFWGKCPKDEPWTGMPPRRRNLGEPRRRPHGGSGPQDDLKRGVLAPPQPARQQRRTLRERLTATERMLQLQMAETVMLRQQVQDRDRLLATQRLGGIFGGAASGSGLFGAPAAARGASAGAFGAANSHFGACANGAGMFGAAPAAGASAGTFGATFAAAPFVAFGAANGHSGGGAADGANMFGAAPAVGAGTGSFGAKFAAPRAAPSNQDQAADAATGGFGGHGRHLGLAAPGGAAGAAGPGGFRFDPPVPAACAPSFAAKLQRMMAMGFGEDICRALLGAADGNIDRALQYLFE